MRYLTIFLSLICVHCSAATLAEVKAKRAVYDDLCNQLITTPKNASLEHQKKVAYREYLVADDENVNGVKVLTASVRITMKDGSTYDSATCIDSSDYTVNPVTDGYYIILDVNRKVISLLKSDIALMTKLP